MRASSSLTRTASAKNDAMNAAIDKCAEGGHWDDRNEDAEQFGLVQGSLGEACEGRLVGTAGGGQGGAGRRAAGGHDVAHGEHQDHRRERDGGARPKLSRSIIQELLNALLRGRPAFHLRDLRRCALREAALGRPSSALRDWRKASCISSGTVSAGRAASCTTACRPRCWTSATRSCSGRGRPARTNSTIRRFSRRPDDISPDRGRSPFETAA